MFFSAFFSFQVTLDFNKGCNYPVNTKTNPNLLKMKNKKKYLGFHIPKIWQILKRFPWQFHPAYTSYFWRVNNKYSNALELSRLGGLNSKLQKYSAEVVNDDMKGRNFLIAFWQQKKSWFIIWRLFSHHSQLQLKDRNSKLERLL